MSIADISPIPDSVYVPFSASGISPLQTQCKIIALKAASYLTDPICKVREYYYSFHILNKTCKNLTQKIMTIVLLTLGIIAFALLTPFTAPVGAALRGVVAAVESKPFVHLQNGKKGKELPQDRKITIVSHNECYMPAGYSITDGQVTPPSDRKRIDANIAKIIELNPDVICLYEVPDICDAFYLTSKLTEYPFVIPVAGVRMIGPSSMMYVASKYEIVPDSIEFIPFLKGTELNGRAAFSEKGFLSFDLRSRGRRVASVISTHLQHSEVPAKPVGDDRLARRAQMTKIVKQIQKKVDDGRNVIFTGDLNQTEDELYANEWGLRRDESVRGQPTWDGDAWCKKLMGELSSGPQVLDYTFIAGKSAAISTKIIQTGYSGLQFRPEATSDHCLLYSTITCADG